MNDPRQFTPTKEPAEQMASDLIVPSEGKAVISLHSQLRTLAIIAAVLICGFAKPLYDLFRFALGSNLFSHVLLIPFISGYLIWIGRHSLPQASPPSRILSVVPAAAGLLALVLAWADFHSGSGLLRHNYLAWTTLSFLLFFAAACSYALGAETLRAVRFPLAFLIFIVPFPDFLVYWIETALQYGSAFTADLFFTATGMTFLRNGLFFQLPGIQLQVAPECSGIHSSLVLFITSLVAGQLFLQKWTNRALLTFAVIPLGILRNAFRIWTIGELCVHISPDMIDSPIHRRGGPLFFVISLLPLFFLIYYQRRWERKQG